MKITIETIPHNCQRYDTCGDWVFNSDGSLDINVSKMPDERSEIAVALHELVEAFLCKKAGITAEVVDQFDMNWKSSILQKYAEPGDDPSAPYHRQHFQAEQIEIEFCTILGLDWDEHCATVDSL